MGLRDDAEKIIADEDARRATVEAEILTDARAKVPGAMAEWTRGMGLDNVPDYTVTDAKMDYDFDDDGQSAHVLLTFEVDGIDFGAHLKLYLGRTSLNVGMVGGSGQTIRTPADVAAVLRGLKKREP